MKNKRKSQMIPHRVSGLKSETTKIPCRSIQNKSRGMLTSSVMLLNNNARPHTAACTQALHIDGPPYSPV
jgi:hypothetical protein